MNGSSSEDATSGGQTDTATGGGTGTSSESGGSSDDTTTTGAGPGGPGELIVFLRYADPTTDREIYTAHVDGTNVTQLTTEGDHFGPAWSPDGLRLVFTRRFDNMLYSEGLYIMDFDGSNLVEVIAPGTLPTISSPTFTPDGRLMFNYSGDPDGEPGLYTVREDGTDQRAFITGMGEYSGEFSPSGDAVVFTRYQRLWIADGDGSAQSELSSLEFVGTARWSRDGQWIAFSAGAAYNDLHLIRRDGTGLQTLTDDMENEYGLSFSADDARIAYGLGYETEVKVMELAGGTVSDLLEGQYARYQP